MQAIRTFIKQSLLFCQRFPAAWISAWIIWFISLWLLSSGNPAPKDLPTIPHLDKIAHFGFFFGGAGLFCAWLRHSRPSLAGIHCLWITALVGATVGVIDEYHQSFTPSRTGNDFGDWIADFAGSICGAAVMLIVLRLAHRRIAQSTTSQPAETI